MRCIALALMCLLSLASPLRAEEIRYCDNDAVWKEIPDTEIRKASIEGKVRIIEKAVHMVRTSDIARRKIRVIVTDCPVYSHRVRAMVRMSVAGFFVAMGYSGYAEDYGIYITLAEIRSMSDDELALVGRQQACLIHGGAADSRYRAHDPLTRDTVECRLATAIALGYAEEAKWFARLLGDDSLVSTSLSVKLGERRPYKKPFK